MLLTIFLACIDVSSLEEAVTGNKDSEIADADGDGILTADDCDDNNPDLGDISNDNDCDGILYEIDCDDEDSLVTNTNENDSDCDTITSDIDCNDEDADITNTNENDADCDTIASDIDCNDEDVEVTNTNENDTDCDTIISDIDCNDEDAEVTNTNENDVDCDLITTDLDCDDYDSTIKNTNENDADCDTIISDIDCDDEDSLVTNTNENDADCDGIVTSEDCDDSDPESTIKSEDADCDSVLTDDDCDDNDSTSTIVVDDMDCDGFLTDEDCDDEDSSITVGTTFFTDNDEDGFGDPNSPVVLCEIQIGYSDDNTDCNDESNQINPDKIDTIDNLTDNNCDGIPGVDEDEDGYASIASGGDDCDDTDLDINPYAGDIWYDGTDNDCAGNDDYDQDGDGYVSDLYSSFSDLPSGDCDDEDASITFNIGYVDGDGDGHGGTQVTYCSTLPQGYFETNTDCDDDDNTVYNEATELCDGQWNDCLTQVDGTNAPEEEIDNDGDGYVECEVEVQGWLGENPVLGGNDCDDEINTVYEGAPEICDNRDNDCDDVLSYEESDADGDGYIICDPNDPNITNSNWGSDIPNSGDCAPADSQRFPGREEICDGVDNDCDNVIDNNATDAEFIAYFDNDEDGYGVNTTSNPPIFHCGNIPENYASEVGDCDDDDAAKSPEIICDGLENECEPMTEIIISDTTFSGQIEVTEDTRYCVQNTAVVEFSALIEDPITIEMYPYYSNNTSSTMPATITCAPSGTNTDYAALLVNETNANIKIDGITFSNCLRTSVIHYYGSGSIDINNATFYNNSNNDEGGAIYVKTVPSDYPTVHINNTLFELNEAKFGGALYAIQAYVTITNSTFDSNETLPSSHTRQGGAITIYGLMSHFVPSLFSDLNIEDTTFIGNSSDDGGAIAALRTNVVIRDTIFEDNSAKSSDTSYKGGVLMTESSNVNIQDSLFHNNNGGSGSAIYSSSSYVELFHNTFSENTDTRRGVVLIHRGPEHKVKNNMFIDNQTDYGAPFIFERDSFSSQPTTNSSSIFMEIENNYFARNTGPVGGILINDTQFELRNNIMAHNYSLPFSSTDDSAGGVLIYNPNQDSIIDGLTIDSNIVDESSYKGAGGLFVLHKSSKSNQSIGLDVSNSLITNNIVHSANTAELSGDMICENCSFQGQNLVTWSKINSVDNRKIDSNNSYVADDKTSMPGNFLIENNPVYYVDNSSNQSQDYRLCTDSSVCAAVTSSVLSQDGTTDYGADPFSEDGYRSYGAFGGTLAAEWDLDNDGYDFCYSIDDALDCTCLDSDDFDNSVNVDDEDVCEE